jgi:drug/metabolite transporter (DMT)-like permease
VKPPAERTRDGEGASHTGVGLALGAALLFGASAPLAKLLLVGAAPQLLAPRPRVQKETPLTRRDAPWLASAIAFGGVLGPLLLMVGLVRSSASSAFLLLNLEGAFTAALAWFGFRENFDRRIALGMVMILIEERWFRGK